MEDNRVLFFKNSNILRVTGLKDGLTGAFLNAATVTATVTTLGGAELLGGTWPVTLDYVPASDGDYEVALLSTLNVEVKQRYIAEISAAQSGKTAFWSFGFTVVNRTG